MISVIIGTYKHLDNLHLILLALQQQSFKDFEVVAAEDDNAPETVAFLAKARGEFSFPIKHVSQEDSGFRKCRILNEAIKIAGGDKLVILDGDCIPHRHCLKRYAKLITEGTICCGRRVMLSEKITQKIIAQKSLRPIRFFRLLLGKSWQVKHALYVPFMTSINNNYCILGCNWGIAKQDMMKINGFDADYQTIGEGEDHDIEWRLRGAGIRLRKVTQCCLSYHLYHKPRHSLEILQPSLQMLQQKRALGLVYCSNGINVKH
jgi:glycosyltransferase involved in cell wall biosynthesis